MSIPGGLIEVEEIANAAIFMASEASSGINGIALPIDAGWSMIHN
jgi:enoyl-[acyl-carrier-protein] reductase (NADH)